MQKLEKAMNEGAVDPGVLSLIDYVNSRTDYYTTSSCSGRITLFHDLGSKPESDWVGKWHRKVNRKEVAEAMKKIPDTGIIWFKYEPSILHIVAKKIDEAKKIMVTARESGYKRVGIQGVKKERFLVEICDTERLDTPVAHRGQILIEDTYLTYLIKHANEKFKAGTEKLGRLEEKLRHSL